MNTLVFLLAISSGRDHTTVITDIVSVIELNHMYDGEGKLVFDQVIWWDWNAEFARYEVRDWRLVQPQRKGVIPTKDRQRGVWVSVFQDGEQMRKVSCLTFRETWTQCDNEMLDREFLAPPDRKLLGRDKP